MNVAAETAAVLQHHCQFLDLEITTRNNFKIGGRPYSVQNAEVESILGFKYKGQRRYADEISVMIGNPHWLTAPEGCETNAGFIHKTIEVTEE